MVQPAVTLREIGRSDHRAVTMRPTGIDQRCTVQPTTKLAQSCDQNGEVLLECASRDINWSHMYRGQLRKNGCIFNRLTLF